VSKAEIPATPAVRALRQHGIAFEPHLYAYEERGGTAHSAVALGVPEHNVVKTLVFETEQRKPLLVLQHGDRQVSVKTLARLLGVKRVTPCDAAAARKHTGYEFGGTSPFGTRSRMPIFAERSIFALDRIYINGGKRGFLVEISPAELKRSLQLQEVEVAL
jgi:Cys-tRNA(Pro) deacylase